MLKNYFKIALRNLRKSATYSFICRCVQAALANPIKSLRTE